MGNRERYKFKCIYTYILSILFLLLLLLLHLFFSSSSSFSPPPPPFSSSSLSSISSPPPPFSSASSSSSASFSFFFSFSCFSLFLCTYRPMCGLPYIHMHSYEHSRIYTFPPSFVWTRLSLPHRRAEEIWRKRTMVVIHP